MKPIQTFGLALILSLASLAAQAAPLTEPQLRSATTPQLAALLLPPEKAALVVSHRIEERYVPGLPLPSSVRFRLAPRQVEGACVQPAYLASIKVYPPSAVSPPVEVERIQDLAYLAFRNCAGLRDEDFAVVQPAAELDGAIATMTWLAGVKAQAAGTMLLDVKLTCRVESGDLTACDGGARQVLARMPLELTFIVEHPYDSRDWRLAIRRQPLSPGAISSPLWQVNIRRPSSGEASVDMVWKIPAPF